MDTARHTAPRLCLRPDAPPRLSGLTPQFLVKRRAGGSTQQGPPPAAAAAASPNEISRAFAARPKVRERLGLEPTFRSANALAIVCLSIVTAIMQQ